jgi:argininosuccinate synthase
MKLYKGEARKAGVRSEYSLYEKQLATYDEEDVFRHEAAEGFIALHGLPSRTEARLQGEALDSSTGEPNIIPPEVRED